MFLRKRILLTFLILYEILTFVATQEYLKDLHPKDIKLNVNDELPPVEIPRPLLLQRQSRSQDIEFNDDFDEESRKQKSQRPTLMDIALEASVREGLSAMRRLYSVLEPEMVKNGHVLQDNHPAALLSKFSAPVVESTRREMAAYATLAAAKAFRKNYDLSNDLARQAHTQKVSLRRTALESLCPPRDPPTCMPASERYRTHDGTCNNRRRLRWGAAQMPFNRFLPPEYGDGVDSTRSSADGGPLSSSRFVSLLVHGAREGEASLTLMLAQWGQLLDHDLTSTAQPRSFNGSVPSCCGNKDFHPSCFPIKVPLDDPWLSPLKVRCLEFLRSAPAQRRDCVLTWREQTNQVTSYIDASPIYSSSVKSSDNARVFRNGLLIFGRGNPADDVCQRGAIATHCIRSGDGRSGEQPGLLALHHVWVHEHNHIAMKLSEMNLHWSDEKIYQEARRIIGAMFQHITYREFLPIVLGREVVKLFDLELLSSGYFEGYDAKTNPTVANAFAAAAFRFGHSLVQNSYMRCDRFHNVMNNNVSLHEEFQRGDIGSVGSLHRLIRGMASQRALKRDEFITPELTNHLFQTPGFPFGLDLAAINIQRGRDHGVPPYTHWRVPCGLTPITTWEEFANVVGPESARRISHAYHSVHDIDLFVGGISERPVVGGLVGPTFACIIAQQFSNSRKGDRFWYENVGFESSFTPAQLHAIRRVTLASVLCRAVGGGTFQPHIFLPPELPDNQRLPCGVGSLGDFDIGPWLEQDPFAPPTARPLHLQPPPPTFKPQPQPDRIFDIMELETKSPTTSDTPISDNKAGFSNRIPTISTTNTKHTPGQIHTPAQIAHVEFVPNASTGFQHTKNVTSINDKLDIKKKGTQGHVTKQKPVPGVNSKLDKNNHRKGGNNRHGTIQTTTRRTIIVNNIPIELRTAAGLNKKTNSKKKNTQTEPEPEPEPRIGDLELTTKPSSDKKNRDNTKTEKDTSTDLTANQERKTEAEPTKKNKLSTDNNLKPKIQDSANDTLKLEGRTEDTEISEKSDKITENHLKLDLEQTKDVSVKLEENLSDKNISKVEKQSNDTTITENTKKLTIQQSTADSLEGRTDDIDLNEEELSQTEKPTDTYISKHKNHSNDSKITENTLKFQQSTAESLEERTDDIDLNEVEELSKTDLKQLTAKEGLGLTTAKTDDTITFSKLDSEATDSVLKTKTNEESSTVNSLTEKQKYKPSAKSSLTENNDQKTTFIEKPSKSSLKSLGKDNPKIVSTAKPSKDSVKTNVSDIDPIIHTTSLDHKRVQREITSAEHLTFNLMEIENLNNFEQDDIRPKETILDETSPEESDVLRANITDSTLITNTSDNVSLNDSPSVDKKRVQRSLTSPTATKLLSTSEQLTQTTQTKTDLDLKGDLNRNSDIEPMKLTLLPTNSDIDLMNDSTPLENIREQRKLTPSTPKKPLVIQRNLTETTTFNNDHKKNSDIDPMMHSTFHDHKRVQRKMTSPTSSERLTTNGKLTETTMTETDQKFKDDLKNNADIDPIIHSNSHKNKRVQRKVTSPTASEQLTFDEKQKKTTLTSTDLNQVDDLRNNDLRNNSDNDPKMKLTTHEHKRVDLKLASSTESEPLTTNAKLTETTFSKTDLRPENDLKNNSDIDAKMYLTSYESKRVQRQLNPLTEADEHTTNIKQTKTTFTKAVQKLRDDFKNNSDIDSTIDPTSHEHDLVQRRLTIQTVSEQLTPNTNQTETTLTKNDLKPNDDDRNNSDIDPKKQLTSYERKRVQHQLTLSTASEQLEPNEQLTKTTSTKTEQKSNDDLKNNSDADPIEQLTSYERKPEQQTLASPTGMEKLKQNLRLTQATFTRTGINLKDDLKNNFDIDASNERNRAQCRLAPRTATKQLKPNIKLTETTEVDTDYNGYNDHTFDPDFDTLFSSTALKHNHATSDKQSRNLKQTETTFTETDLRVHENHKNDSNNDSIIHYSSDKHQTTETSLAGRNENFENDSNIDPTLHLTSHDSKQRQRKLTPPATTEQLKDKTKFSALNNIAKTNNSAIMTNRTLTTKSPRPHRTTFRNVELRQYQNRPSYTKPPQKVIVDSVHGDNQYEIEINIRKTNKSPNPLQSTPYVSDYTNGYKPNQYDRYTPNYPPYTTTTPIYAYFQPLPTQISSLTQNQRTKPPTIIFINEQEPPERTTTRQPGFLHSIIGWNSQTNKRPLPQSINGEESGRPAGGYDNVIASPHSTAVVAPAYQNLRPSSQATAPASISSFSQAQLGANVAQASSSAVSNGHFGTIAGFASANGADSTFSFNIRPKPDKTQLARPDSVGVGGSGAGSYGLAKPPRNPWYPQKQPEYINLPIPTHEQTSPPYRENDLSPFSSANSQTYYIRKKPGLQRKEFLTLGHSQEFTDYDYTSRLAQPLHNLTSSEEDGDDVDIDTEYDEDYASSPLIRKFNRDGYLRPEHMINTVLKTINDKTDETAMNLTRTDNGNQTLDDNYVMPVINSTKDLPVDLPKPINTNFSTDFPDSLGKHFNNDIFAEDLDNIDDSITADDKTETFLEFKGKRNRNNHRNHEKIAFAPINVLTKPERPDNWVIFESPQEEPLLPQIPAINMDPLPSAEVPKPLKENSWLNLTNLKRKLALQFLETSEQLKKEKTDITKTETISTDGPQTEFTDTRTTN